jgi:ketosteroid isomerase-like protein
MKHLRTTVILLALCCARGALAADPGMTAAECEVWERERTFAESVARHDPKAFAEHVHADAVFGAASPGTQKGRDTIVAAWTGIIEGKNVILEWRPQYVSIGADANVAMSRGPFVFTAKDADGKTKYGIGQFVSVWVRKDGKSPWYVALDGGGPPPTVVSEEEAKKHLAIAPAACPRN